MIIYAASFLTQISSLPSRAVRSFQDGSSAFHVEATVLQVDPQNVQVSHLNRRQNFPHSPGRCALVSHIMANDSSNETQRFSTYLTVPTDCKRHESVRRANKSSRGNPLKNTSPSYAVVFFAATMSSRVVLPHPEGPMMATISPHSTTPDVGVKMTRAGAAAVRPGMQNCKSLKAMRDLPNARASR